MASQSQGIPHLNGVSKLSPELSAICGRKERSQVSLRAERDGLPAQAQDTAPLLRVAQGPISAASCRIRAAGCRLKIGRLQVMQGIS